MQCRRCASISDIVHRESVCGGIVNSSDIAPRCRHRYRSTHLLSEEISVSEYQAELDRHFDWFERKLPYRFARFLSWVRRPSSRLVRVPLALLLVLGGIFSFLPVLGLWMLPLGLLLIAQDIPMLQKPIARLLGWMERKWIERQRARGKR
jgi:hypothetical protein